VVKYQAIDFFEVILSYSGTQTLFKRHVKPGNQGAIRSPSLRSSGPPLNPMECGFCHGIASLFLPIGAGRPGVAVSHAPVGVAQRPCHRLPNDTGTYTPTAKAPP
jgi:hypothetical protein